MEVLPIRVFGSVPLNSISNEFPIQKIIQSESGRNLMFNNMKI